MYKNKKDVNNSNNVLNIKMLMEVFMRKDVNGRIKENNRENIWVWIACGICVLAIIYTVMRIFSQKSNEENIAEISKYNANMNITNQTSESSSTIGKTVNEVKNEIEGNSLKNEIKNNTTEKASKSEKENTNTNTKNNTISVKENNYVLNKTEKSEKNTQANEITTSQTVEDLKLCMPVDGEIIKEFAKDNLVYSETLKEWVTHTGIDIKADKTSIVKAAAKGKVASIKNDPRYGLTVIINHDNGFQTIYANLLTAEFVVEGEELEEGQTIGTVGNTATFEIADDFHLHFEVLKNNEYVDPTLYMK